MKKYIKVPHEITFSSHENHENEKQVWELFSSRSFICVKNDKYEKKE